MRKQKVYMVSIPENADYAEWWHIIGLFSTREKANRFIETHPIRKYEQNDGTMKPKTKYYKIQVIEIDNAPLLEKGDIRNYFGKDRHITRKEKLRYKKFLKIWRRREQLSKELEKIDKQMFEKDLVET